MAKLTFGASANINPSVFVTIDTSGSAKVLQASANTQALIGVSQEFAKWAPTPAQGSQAAEAGDPIAVFSIGEVCLLNAGTAGWTAGDRLTSDASGNGTTASASQYYGAIAKTTLTGAGLGLVEVVLGKSP